MGPETCGKHDDDHHHHNDDDDDDSKKCDDDVQVSCLARGSDGRNLTVTQLAEKDQVIIMIY